MRWMTGLTLLAGLLGAATGVQAGQIYLLSSDGANYNNATNFGVVDSSTGAYTQIAANVNNGDLALSLAWNPAVNAFYTSGMYGKFATIGTNGVMSTELGNNGKKLYGMAYQGSSDRIFAYDYNNDDFGSLAPSNGAWTLLTGSPGISPSSPLGGRMVFHTGTLYTAINESGGQFGTFATTAGSTSQQIGPNNAPYAYMVLASDGTTLYGLFADGIAGNQRLYIIDALTGALTAGPNITGTGLQRYFHGAGIVPAAAVPEPGTVGLALAGVGVLGVRAWRRRARA